MSEPSLLTFHKGDTIHVIEKDTDTAGWYRGEILLQDAAPRKGLFPSKIVKMLLRPPPGVSTSLSATRPRSRSILEDEVASPGAVDRRRSGSVYRRSAMGREALAASGSGSPAGGAGTMVAANSRKSVRQSISLHATGAPKDWRTSRLIDQGKRSSGASSPKDRESGGSATIAKSDSTAERRGRWSAIAVDTNAFSWEGYARKYFRAPMPQPPLSPSSSGTARSKTLRAEPAGGSVTARAAEAAPWAFSKEPLSTSLLVLAAEATKVALEANRSVMKFMNDLPHKESELSCLQHVGRLLLANPGVRDEIYAQILKQCTDNPNLYVAFRAAHSPHCSRYYSESLTKGTVLLTSLIGLALPRDTLLKHLISHLLVNSRHNGIYAELAALSRTGLDLILRRRDGCGDRTQPTSQQELDAIESSGQLCAVVFFPDNTTRAVDIDSLTTVGEVVASLGELRSLAGWSLCEIISGRNYCTCSDLRHRHADAQTQHRFSRIVADVASVLHDKVLVCDLITRWEQFEIPKEVEGAVDWRLTFQKALMLPEEQGVELESPAITAMLYHQLLAHLQQGRLLPTEEDAVTLAALQLWISEGDYNPSDVDELRRNLAANIDIYVPRSLLKHVKIKSRPGRYIAKLCGLSGSIRTPIADLAGRISMAYASLPPMKTQQAMRQWLQLIKQAEFYGSTLFVVQVRPMPPCMSAYARTVLAGQGEGQEARAVGGKRARLPALRWAAHAVPLCAARHRGVLWSHQHEHLHHVR